MHVHYKYIFKLCAKCTVHGDNLMSRDITKFTTYKLNIDTINRHTKLPRLAITFYTMRTTVNIKQ